MSTLDTHDTHGTLSPPEPATLRNSVASIEKEDVLSKSPTVADLPTLNADKESISESAVTRTPGDQPADPEKNPEGRQPPAAHVLADMAPARKNVLLFGFVSVHALGASLATTVEVEVAMLPVTPLPVCTTVDTSVSPCSSTRPASVRPSS